MNLGNKKDLSRQESINTKRQNKSKCRENAHMKFLELHEEVAVTNIAIEAGKYRNVAIQETCIKQTVEVLLEDYIHIISQQRRNQKIWNLVKNESKEIELNLYMSPYIINIYKYIYKN